MRNLIAIAAMLAISGTAAIIGRVPNHPATMQCCAKKAPAEQCPMKAASAKSPNPLVCTKCQPLPGGYPNCAQYLNGDKPPLRSHPCQPCNLQGCYGY